MTNPNPGILTISLSINTSNQSFEFSPEDEVRGILTVMARLVSDEVARGFHGNNDIPLRDANGNTVGTAYYAFARIVEG